MLTLSKIGSSLSISPCPRENMLLANVFASSCPIRWGGRALATERILGTVKVVPDVSAGQGQALSRARDAHRGRGRRTGRYACAGGSTSRSSAQAYLDRKSTRLNSSHLVI